MIKKVAIPVVAFVLGVFLAHFLWNRHMDSVYRELDNYVDGVYAVQRTIIESVPIYDDFVKPGFEEDLRKYLFPQHMRVAREQGTGPVADTGMVETLVKGEKLELIDGEDLPYYFYGVKKEHRYLTPSAAAGLKIIAETFNRVCREHGIKGQLKFPVSSALRPGSYQQKLRGSNMNAVSESTHSYGVSFDLFFDDYYVVLPEIKGNGVLASIVSEIRSRMGYMMGDAVRRQGKTLLAMTVHGLQEQGVIYVTLERKQRCFHVTVVDPGKAENYPR